MIPIRVWRKLPIGDPCSYRDPFLSLEWYLYVVVRKVVAERKAVRKVVAERKAETSFVS